MSENKETSRLKCGFTLCIHNSSCCVAPSSYDNAYCNKSNCIEEVGLMTEIDKTTNETIYTNCDNFILNEKKTPKCIKCQIDDYGEVSMALVNLNINYSELRKNMNKIIEDGDDFI